MPPSTPIGIIGPFKPIHDYPIVNPSGKYPSVKLLHQEYKTNSGFVNYYHIDYIDLSDRFKKDAVKEIYTRPFEYFSRVGNALVIYCNPSSHAPFIDKNYQHIKGYASLVNLNFTGYKKFKRDDFPFVQALPVFLLHLFLVVALIYCLKMRLFGAAETPVIWVMTFMLGYAMIVGVFFEYGENNRFRFEHLSVFVILFMKTLYTLISRWRNVPV
jgi:hypothetical protein